MISSVWAINSNLEEMGDTSFELYYDADPGAVENPSMPKNQIRPSGTGAIERFLRSYEHERMLSEDIRLHEREREHSERWAMHWQDEGLDRNLMNMVE